MIKTPKSIFAISIDVPAIPPKPKIPAMMAMIKNDAAQLSIVSPYYVIRWDELKNI